MTGTVLVLRLLPDQLRHVLGDAHAVGADDNPQSPLRGAPDDLEDVAPEKRLAARQDRQAFRGERGNLVDDPEAFLGAELASIGEVLGANERRAAGVEVAVLARKIAAIGEVPRDDVGAGEEAAFICGLSSQLQLNRQLPNAQHPTPDSQ